MVDCAAEAEILDRVRPAMQELVATDDWLPAAAAVPHERHYQQYLLYRDSEARFSVVSFVWGPGQKTPIHDHMTWGVIGMLRGSEVAESFQRGESGSLSAGAVESLRPGDVAVVSPNVGDIHRVQNAFADRVSISVHVYGTDIGKRRRHVFDPTTGAPKEFVSGYSLIAAEC
ncbi:MAG: cysteine dioxygenase [Rubrivivax sp.]